MYINLLWLKTVLQCLPANSLIGQPLDPERPLIVRGQSEPRPEVVYFLPILPPPTSFSDSISGTNYQCCGSGSTRNRKFFVGFGANFAY
jgi:hypothetical protein